MSGFSPISLKASTTISAYRIVVALTATANTVKAAAAATELPLGISLDTCLDTSLAIPIQMNGIAKLYFNDTVGTGKLVAADASGRGVPHVDTTAGSYVVGTLIGPAVAATGTIAEVLVNPFFKSIP